jgi:hypothetical protein
MGSVQFRHVATAEELTETGLASAPALLWAMNAAAGMATLEAAARSGGCAGGRTRWLNSGRDGR